MKYIQAPGAPKGGFSGTCNRTACHEAPAVCWNAATKAYYCAWCALQINRAARDVTLCVRDEADRTEGRRIGHRVNTPDGLDKSARTHTELCMQVDRVREQAQDEKRTDGEGMATDYFLVSYRELMTLRRDEVHFIPQGQPYRFRGVRLAFVEGYGIFGVIA